MTINKEPTPREALQALANRNPGTCKCGHTSDVHGFGGGDCWPCAYDFDNPDCYGFEAEAQ